MKNKTTTVLVSLIVGISLGYIMWGTKTTPTIPVNNSGGVTMHQMPDGQMMNNVGMDMDDMMKGMMVGLEGKTGDDFDKAFIAEMVVHHEGAVEMAQAVLKTSKRPELLKLANDIITAQTKEIGMMRGWNSMWFK